MLVPPVISFDAIDKAELNDCLVAWSHKMGPWERPDFGSEAFHGLRHHDNLVAVTATARMIPAETAGYSRSDTCELGRVCAARPGLNRVVLRLWREFVFPEMCRAHGWRWAISYQDAAIHSGDLYRFDGWLKVGSSRSGPDKRGHRQGRNKAIWAWCVDPDELSRRRDAMAAILLEPQGTTP